MHVPFDGIMSACASFSTWRVQGWQMPAFPQDCFLHELIHVGWSTGEQQACQVLEVKLALMNAFPMIPALRREAEGIGSIVTWSQA